MPACDRQTDRQTDILDGIVDSMRGIARKLNDFGTHKLHKATNDNMMPFYLNESITR